MFLIDQPELAVDGEVTVRDVVNLFTFCGRLLIFVYRYWNSVDSKYVNQELTFSHFAQKLTWRVRLKVYFWNKINLV